MKNFYLIIAASLVLNTVGYASDDAIPQKIVEIHMFRNDPPAEQTAKKKKNDRKIEILPLSEGICSGEFIDNTGDILTARHCVDRVDSFVVTTFDQQHYTATVVYVSPNHDLAMLHIDRLGTSYFDLASNVRQGERVFTYGSPLGITGTLSTGIIAKLDGDLTLIDCSVLPGNSGCPLINTMGQLIGTVTAGYIVGMGTTHLNIAQSLDVIRFFLYEALKART